MLRLGKWLMNYFFVRTTPQTLLSTNYHVDFWKEEFMVRSKWHSLDKKYENAINIWYKIGEKVSIIQFFWRKFLFHATICTPKKLYSYVN